MSETEQQPKREKPKSRSKRWADAVMDATTAIETMQQAVNELEGALDDLKSVQEEYSEWKDNLPENLQNGPMAEKLDAVCDLDLDVLDNLKSAIEEAADKVEEAESMELPMGFGRD